MHITCRVRARQPDRERKAASSTCPGRRHRCHRRSRAAALRENRASSLRQKRIRRMYYIFFLLLLLSDFFPLISSSTSLSSSSDGLAKIVIRFHCCPIAARAREVMLHIGIQYIYSIAGSPPSLVSFGGGE